MKFQVRKFLKFIFESIQANDYVWKKTFSEKKALTTSIIQEYYKLLFEEVATMKRNKQKEEKDIITKIVKHL